MRVVILILLSLSLHGASPIVDPTLKAPRLLGAQSDPHTIALRWESILDDRIVGYYIYRSGANDPRLVRIDRVEHRESSRYVDTKLTQGHYRYRISSVDRNEHESNGSNPIEIDTLSPLGPVTQWHAGERMPQKTHMLWEPHPSERVRGYRIEYQEGNETQWRWLVELSGRLHGEYFHIGLPSGVRYRYRIAALTSENDESGWSPMIETMTSPLPPRVEGVVASTSLIRRITLAWSPLVGAREYRIYRSRFKDMMFEPCGNTAKAQWEDRVETDGERYYYKITVLDALGLESSLGTTSPIEGKTLDKPHPPKLSYGKITPNSLEVRWKSTDPRVVSYILVQRIQKDWLTYETREYLTPATIWSAQGIDGHWRYTFTVVGVDAYGIRSVASEPIYLHYEE